MLALTFSVALVVALAPILGGGAGIAEWVIRQPLRVVLTAVAIAGLYLAPGLLLLRLLWPNSHSLSWPMRIALAPGISIALPPVILIIMQDIGLPWGQIQTWAYLVLCLTGLIATLVVDRRAGATNIAVLPALISPLLFGICGAALLIRLYIVRDLPTGLLGDSFHHTMMAQLIVNHGGIFHSWQPYAPLTTFTYHFGFHANVAFFHWLSGLDVVSSTIWTGQVLNASAIPLAFALTVVLSRSPWGGIWAALITGFIAVIPSYYVNWGRYTQLTGQLVLVGLVVAWMLLAETEVAPTEATSNAAKLRHWFGVLWKPLLLTAILTASMVLTHYLVTVFAIGFLMTYLVTLALVRRDPRFIQSLILRSACVGFVALLIIAPWIMNLLNGFLVRNASGFVSGGVEAERIAQYSTIPALVPFYAKSYVLFSAFIGLIIAIWQRAWRMSLLALWCAILILCVIPQVVGLPGTGLIDYLTAFSALYIPLAPLAGYAIGVVQSRVQGMLSGIASYAFYTFASAILIGVIAWGAAWHVQLISGNTQMVTAADLRAIDWIRVNTPTTARFLVNSFPAYGGNLIAGTDAGWWLPLLANREVTVPPLTYGSEQAELRDYAHRVNTLAEKLRGRSLRNPAPVSVDLTTDQAIMLLRDAGITYVYSGAHPFPSAREADRINTHRLRASPLFRLLYDQDGVEIFEFLGQPISFMKAYERY